MKELELQVYQTKATISTNFDEMQNEVQSIADAYVGLEVTEDNMTERKADRATLRKIQKALDDKRKEVKKEHMKPLEEFEKNVKDLIEIIQRTIIPIDSSIKEYEEEQLNRKKEEIKEYYSQFPISERVPLSSIYDSKWNLVSTSMKSIKKNIDETVSEIGQAVAVIKGMNTDKEEDAIEMYLDTFNMMEVIAYINKYEQQKREIEKQYEEQRKKDEEARLEKERQRIREEERQRVADEQAIREQSYNQGKEEVVSSMSVKPFDNIKVSKIVNFYVDCNEDELNQIQMYLDSIGVDYDWEVVSLNG